MRKLFIGISMIAILIVAGGCAPALINAAFKGDINKVNELLKHGANASDSTYGYGATALMAAASKGHVELVKVLLDSGAHINTTCRGASTALGSAAASGHTDVVQLLLDRGADLDLAIRCLSTHKSHPWAQNGITVLSAFKAQRGLTGARSDAGKLPAPEKPIKENPKAKFINISVMDLNTTSGLSNPEILLLTAKLINSLVKAGFTVIERGKRDEILKEQGFQQSGACSESSCLVEVGQLLGVQKMIGGTIGKFGDEFVIELRLINVGTAKIEDSFSRTYQGNISYLLDGMVDAADSFSKSVK
jgi:hypothetical protein